MIMNKRISRLCCALLCSFPVIASAQNVDKITSPVNLYEEGRVLFLQKNYAAANTTLQSFVHQDPESRLRQEAEYMLVCTAYELKDSNSLQQLERYLEVYPDSPYANRIYALMGACFFYQRKFPEALAMLNSSHLYQLSDAERDQMTYMMATCYLELGNLSEAAVWFETLKASSTTYDDDCTYYLSYIRYMQQRYDEALNGFVSLQYNGKYEALVPYYIAEIYLLKHQPNKAIEMAQKFLNDHPSSEYTAEMYRIIGEAYYELRNYNEAIKALSYYASHTTEPRRDALYMLGIAYFQTGVNSKAAETLAHVTTQQDALTQNAYLHMGLAYLNLAERNKARMAFEQAANMDFNAQIKEQAAYNYALALHETSYSGFGESVTAFEKFLNSYPNSPYKEMVSNYLVEVYLTTRSYDSALTSIDRIKQPDRRILEAKQKILFHLGTEAVANAAYQKAINYLDLSIALGQYNQATKTQALYWRGESYYRLGELNQAAQNFKQYLQQAGSGQNEMTALANYGLGYIAFKQKQYAEARTYFTRYADLAGNQANKALLADANNRIADTYLNNRQFDEAKQYYAQSEGMHEASGDYAFYQMALVSGLQKDNSGKISLLNRLIGKYPNSPYAVNALYEKGRAYVMLENNNQAINAFSDLVEKYPASPLSRKAAAEIGLLYYQDGAFDKAIAAYKQVVQKYPGSEEARLAMLDLKSIYVDMNRIEEFAALANSMPGNFQFDASEQDSLTYIAAEKIYMRGRIEESKGSFQRYLQSYPQGAFVLNSHYYLSRIANEQKNQDQLLLHSGELLKFPDSPYAEEALLMRAPVLFEQRRYPEALATYNQLREKTMNPERRILAETGMLRSAYLMKDDVEIINAATTLLNEPKLSPELTNEALYYRAKSYLNHDAEGYAMQDLTQLAKDTRNLYGAEAKYMLANQLYKAGKYNEAEAQLLNYIDQSTPHIYWLARSFVLLSDVYVAMNKPVDARQYLLSLQQNYTAQDDIPVMIKSRLEKLNK